MKRSRIKILSSFFISLGTFATDNLVKTYVNRRNVSSHIKSINEGINRVVEYGTENNREETYGIQNGTFPIDNRFAVIYHWMERNEKQYPWYNTNIQVFENDSFLLDNIEKLQKTEISVSDLKTVEAAVALHNRFPEAKIAIHNYADAVIPGGGFLVGWTTQEEDIAKKTTLMAGLYNKTTWEKFYQKAHNNTDDHFGLGLVYGTNVYVVFRGDQFTPVQRPFLIDVLTSAAKDLSPSSTNLNNDEILRTQTKNKFRNTVMAAIFRNDKILVTGAWGCGAFKNDPKEMAKIMHEILIDEGWGKYFDRIEFAMGPCGGDSRKAFDNQFTQIDTEQFKSVKTNTLDEAEEDHTEHLPAATHEQFHWKPIILGGTVLFLIGGGFWLWRTYWK